MTSCGTLKIEVPHGAASAAKNHSLMRPAAPAPPPPFRGGGSVLGCRRFRRCPSATFEVPQIDARNIDPNKRRWVPWPDGDSPGDIVEWRISG